MSKNLLIAIILLSIISGIIIAGCGSGGTGQISVPPTATQTQIPSLVNIKGQALEINGTPIPNAFVVCINLGLSASLSTLADTLGNYLFKNLPPGNYRIEIWRSEGDHNSSPGSPIGAVNITVTEGTITVNVTAGTIDPTATPTVTPAVTNTPTATNTPGGPTNTPTATNTPGGPTNTPTDTPTPSWKNVGNAGFSAGEVENPSLYVYNGIPYVAYRDGGNGNKATVMMYNGTVWTNVGNAGFSAGVVDCVSLYVYNGIPYVAYRDGGNGNKATVMTYNGTVWTPVGTVGFSAGEVYDTSLYVYDEKPYVAYTDVAHNHKATVMMYNGTVWTNVGNAGFSVLKARSMSLSVYEGKPYLAYGDYTTDLGGAVDREYIRVMTYNGTNWVHVGTEGFSGGEGQFPSLYVYNGLPYVAYEDFATGKPISVMMYNGTNWVPVGNEGLSGYGVQPSLYVYNGIPYVAYTDNTKCMAIVEMYNGTSWTYVGTEYFSEGDAWNLSLYVSNGIPYVAYMDWAHDYKSTVMKFSN